MAAQWAAKNYNVNVYTHVALFMSLFANLVFPTQHLARFNAPMKMEMECKWNPILFCSKTTILVPFSDLHLLVQKITPSARWTGSKYTGVRRNRNRLTL